MSDPTERPDAVSDADVAPEPPGTEAGGADAALSDAAESDALGSEPMTGPDAGVPAFVEADVSAVDVPESVIAEPVIPEPVIPASAFETPAIPPPVVPPMPEELESPSWEPSAPTGLANGSLSQGVSDAAPEGAPAPTRAAKRIRTDWSDLPERPPIASPAAGGTTGSYRGWTILVFVILVALLIAAVVVIGVLLTSGPSLFAAAALPASAILVM